MPTTLAVSYIDSEVTSLPKVAKLKVTKTTLELIKETEIKYNLKTNILRDTIKCESGFNHNDIYGDNGLAYGIAQFHKPTFVSFAKEYDKDFVKELDYYSKEDQIELAGWAFANNKASHWTCWRLITKK